MIRKFLDLSTAHLPRQTAAEFEAEAKERAAGGAGSLPFSVKGDDTGFFVYVPQDPEDDAHLPPGFRDVAQHARALCCDYVLFDRDAGVVDGLPVYDW